MAGWGLGVHEILVVRVAVSPLFTGLVGLNDWMPGFLEVGSRVFVLRVVAAADLATYQAQSQVDPGVALIDTLDT
jgi:hypothetical protein